MTYEADAVDQAIIFRETGIYLRLIEKHVHNSDFEKARQVTRWLWKLLGPALPDELEPWTHDSTRR